MTIEDFIYKKNIVRDNNHDYLTTHIDRVIESVCSISGLTVKRIATNYVFPRIVEAKEENVLIWDQTYWELFELFMLYFTDMNTIHKMGFTCDEDFENPKILIPLTYYLAMIIDEKELALNFAYYYKCRINKSQAFSMEISLNEFFEFIEIAKMYVAVHEQTHFKYKKDRMQKMLDLKAVEEMLDIVYKIFESYDESYCKEKYLKRKSELLALTSFAKSDNDLKEELLCDTYALNNCISVYTNVFRKKYSKTKIITKCMETIRIVNYYNSILISLKIYWKICNHNINEVNIHQQAIALRLYIFEVISALQIVQQDLQDYDDKDLWNYNEFEDNHLLDDVMYSYFFNEKAPAYWKSIFPLYIRKKLSDKDIYELLNWR